MTLLIRRHKLAYFPVPKVACTSIKHMLHEMKTGKPFTPRLRNSGRTIYVHDVYPAFGFPEHPHDALADWHRVAVVRDPVRRLLSAYGNRVVHYRELSPEVAGDQLAEVDLPPDPDLATFIDNLDGYTSAVRKIGHHTRPLVHFLGRDPGYFSRLYAFSELGRFETDMQALTGKPVSLRHRQTGGPKLSPQDLTAAQIARIEAFYAEDYTVFEAFLDRPAR